MLHFDVNNGIARRAWARNTGALTSIERAQQQNPSLQVTSTYLADEAVLNRLF
jgi:urocanate hydratase